MTLGEGYLGQFSGLYVHTRAYMQAHACMCTLSLINTHTQRRGTCMRVHALTHKYTHGRRTCMYVHTLTYKHTYKGAAFHSVSGQYLWRKNHPYRYHWETFSILTQVHSVPRTTEKTLHAICPGIECILTH